MNRRKFILSGIAAASLLSGCLDQEETETETDSIEEYPVGFNERDVSPNTVEENHKETILNSDSITSELTIKNSGYTEREVGKKDAGLRSIDLYINDSDQASLSRISSEETTYTRDRTQGNMYSLEKGKILSAESIGHLSTLNTLLSSIIIRSNGLKDNEIIYNIAGTSNNSQLDQLFSTPAENYSGELRINSETGIVTYLKLNSSDESQEILYSFEMQGDVSDWSETAEDNIASISATTDGNTIKITTQDDTIQKESSLIVIPSRLNTTYDFVFDQSVSENTTWYYNLVDGNIQATAEPSDVSSSFSEGKYTVILLDPQGSELKRFELSM